MFRLLPFNPIDIYLLVTMEVLNIHVLVLGPSSVSKINKSPKTSPGSISWLYWNCCFIVGDPFKQEGFGASDPFSGSDPFTEGGDSYKQPQAPASWGIKPTDDWGDDPYVKRQQEAVDSFRVRIKSHHFPTKAGYFLFSIKMFQKWILPFQTDPFKHGDDSFEAAFSAAKTKKGMW